ncbi:MAG: alkaline phosphatase family protein [Patescibacteria group bacterium]
MSITGGIVGFSSSLLILATTIVFIFFGWLIIRFWAKPKRKITKFFKFVLLGLLCIIILFNLIYGGIYLYRFSSDHGKITSDDKYLVIMVADGASLIQAKELFMKGLDDQSSYLTSINKAFPNISKYFIQNGSFTANGVSVWPSSSIPAHTGIVTGSYPRNTGVMGQRQFDPVERRHTSYIGLGILQHQAILSKSIKTLCEYFPEVRSVDVLQIANRGCSLYIPGTPHDEQVIKRTEQIVNATDYLSKYSKKDEIPKIIIMTLPDIDHQTHNSALNDEKSIDLYLKTDQYVGKIFELYKEKGIFDKTLFVLASDHGMGEVKNHITLDNIVNDMRFNTFKSLKWSVIPAWGSFEANFYVGTKAKFDNNYNSVSLWGGNSDGLLYIKGQEKDNYGKIIKESWDIRTTDEMLENYNVGGTNINVIEKIIEYSPGIGLVLTNPQENVFNIYSSLGQGQILERKDGDKIEFQYSVIKGNDPLGYTKNNIINNFIKSKSWLSDQEWLQLTYLEHYPDALRRISYSFENQNSATMHLVAADGWDFTPYYVAKDVLVGSHGSLNSQQSLVPIMFYGPGIKNSEMPYARTVDILPTILKYFDISTSVDGKPLPIFSDKNKNEQTIDSGISSILNPNIQDDKYFYALEDIYASYDKRIIKINKQSSEKEIVTNSIKESLPELNEKVNVTLRLDGIENNNLILKKIYVAENKEGKTYLFNINERRFSK